MGSRYEKEKKAFDSWIKKYLKDLTRKLISDPGYRQEFGIYKSFKEDGSYERHPYIKPLSRLDGRVHMLSAVYAGSKTCNYCIAVQRVVLDALEGFEYFWPRREKCAACPGKGQNNRKIMDFFGGTSLPGNVNSAENTWFYVSENSLFNREVSICCGLFDSAFMLEDLLNAVSEKTDKSRLEIVFGGLDALEDIKNISRSIRRRRWIRQNSANFLLTAVHRSATHGAHSAHSAAVRTWILKQGWRRERTSHSAGCSR